MRKIATLLCLLCLIAACSKEDTKISCEPTRNPDHYECYRDGNYAGFVNNGIDTVNIIALEVKSATTYEKRWTNTVPIYLNPGDTFVYDMRLVEEILGAAPRTVPNNDTTIKTITYSIFDHVCYDIYTGRDKKGTLDVTWTKL